ncbi:dipeptidase [Tsukamurella paurometabola]|uniref:Membrane dipeptidase n=1 Tax=Tsukamurella paurometabola TaxID=2061 RepID=A0ABS5N8H6_TSUPA|nr:membrane dipeptidase [Tsukamurella paurometabola]MBS4100579.1 membrane dipeptidase [Tsukamurella paurometabola]
MKSLVWDQHACLPLTVGTDVAPLLRFASSSPTYVSVNAGYRPQSFADSAALLGSFRSSIDACAGLRTVGTVDELRAAGAAGEIAVAFDLEDAAPLDGDLDNVARLADLGVRTVAPTYNSANRAGSGCLDATDAGLTRWGRDLVARLNASGVVPDGSHCGRRTGLDIAAATSGPMVYSHSCMAAVWEHPRNITDDQARACAETGGVVGITGVGIFLGPNTPTLEAMARHLEYAVELIGIEHVGVSTDHSFDSEDFLAELAANPDVFDESYTRWGPIRWMPPEDVIRLGAHLAGRGWSPSDIEAVTGGNFLRVAERSWARR